jgi:hypothetical protein
MSSHVKEDNSSCGNISLRRVIRAYPWTSAFNGMLNKILMWLYSKKSFIFCEGKNRCLISNFVVQCGTTNRVSVFSFRGKFWIRYQFILFRAQTSKRTKHRAKFHLACRFSRSNTTEVLLEILKKKWIDSKCVWIFIFFSRNSIKWYEKMTSNVT